MVHWIVATWFVFCGPQACLLPIMVTVTVVMALEWCTGCWHAGDRHGLLYTCSLGGLSTVTEPRKLAGGNQAWTQGLCNLLVPVLAIIILLWWPSWPSSWPSCHHHGRPHMHPDMSFQKGITHMHTCTCVNTCTSNISSIVQSIQACPNLLHYWKSNLGMALKPTAQQTWSY